MKDKRKTAVGIEFRIKRMSIILFARDFTPYKTCQLGISIDKGSFTDKNLNVWKNFDLELKLLIMGVGVRFGWISEES